VDAIREAILRLREGEVHPQIVVMAACWTTLPRPYDRPAGS
jgi:hypothetical protein